MQNSRRQQGRENNFNRDARERQARRFRGTDYDRHSTENARYDREMNPVYQTDRANWGGESDLDTGSPEYSRERSREGSYGGYEQPYGAAGGSPSYGSANYRQGGGYEQHYGTYDRHYGPVQNDMQGGYRGTQTESDRYETLSRSGSERMGLSESLSDRLSPRQGYGSEQNWSTPQGRFYGKGPKGYRRSDDRLKEEVSDALTRDSHIDASEIEVAVESGVVTLRGTVEERRMKRMAEDCVERVEGVSDIRNEIRVESKSMESGSRTGSMGGGSALEQTRKAGAPKTSSEKIM